MKANRHAVFKSPVLWGAIAVALFLGTVLGIGLGRRGGHAGTAGHVGHRAEAETWMCSMHPQIRQPEPGRCPICGMDLIALRTGDGGKAGPRELRMSKGAMELAEIRTETVQRRFIDVKIPLVGKVDYDETRVKTISAWVPGRLDRLFVDYTGVPVRPGDHLVEIYSPELYAAQEEFLQALGAVRGVRAEATEYVRRSSSNILAAAREKLRLLGLEADQVAAIEKRGTPSAAVEIRSPIGGVVIHKNAQEGVYVKTGTPIYTVADLTRVWVRLDAYESDLPWLRYGQKVDIRTAAYGDRAFRGWVSFIDPVLNPATRTVKVRVVVDNTTGVLRPNMFVRATIFARVGDGEVVLGAPLEGKWICPMHPEVVKDESGACDECGMDLVAARELGYASHQAVDPPMVVPRSAVLLTGRRAVVYVRQRDESGPSFKGVEIEIGPRAGDYYVVRSGLSEGQEVVVHGNFKIDSALQLLAKRSMMSPEVGNGAAHPAPAASGPVTVPDDFRNRLGGLIEAYYAVHEALAGDDASSARGAATALVAELRGMDATELAPEALAAWRPAAAATARPAAVVGEATDIQKQREAFARLSTAMETVVKRFAPQTRRAVRRAYCPMAFDNKGAHWLQPGKEIANPYFGAAMFRCGEIKGVLVDPDRETHED